ncbi:RNA-binding La1 [Fusarium circinatum]|uniref:RNA-binding La1 n=1 Tax=Fusarium circinatum TaxID=48490 RepID=A0A8H5UID3_FUSCI|nr:RNA-binding La1 [Fusarium circinatum]
MSEAEAPKPVEAVQPEAEVPATQPTEEKVEEKTEQKAEESTEKPEEKPEEKKEILKTTAKHDDANPRNNRKFDPSTREITDDPEAIRKQVEFYFGDWNFPQDKFMWESCGGSENKPMKVKTIHSFKRMRTFQPYTAVIAALKDSKFLELSGEEGEEVVKRKTPYQPMNAPKSKVEAATVYVKGFGDEAPNTQFDLESFFAQFGEVKGLKLRRTNEGLFKGSVFVTFADEDEANKFVKIDPKPKWKDHDLKIMSKRAYCDEKNDLIRQGKIEPNQSNPRKFYEGRETGKGGRGRGGKDSRGRDQDDWKQRRETDQKNGFKDRRGGRGGRGGRGRGRGRGGRDGGRDRNQSKDEVKHSSNDTTPRIQSTTDESADNKKRSRDEDAPSGEPAAKKVDVKAE